MLWVRFIKSHVGERLHERLNEWEHSVALMVFGSVLAAPQIMLPQLPHENGWGIAIFVLGTVRFGSLVINGMRRKITTWLRALSAAVGCLVFGLISLAFVSAHALDGAAALFPVIAIFEIFNYGRAMRDAGNSHGRPA